MSSQQKNAKKLCMTFEDMIKVPEQTLAHIVKELDLTTWSLALKGASPDVTKHVLASASQEFSNNLHKSMVSMGSVPIGQVEQAQKMIVERLCQEDCKCQIVTRDEEDEGIV